MLRIAADRKYDVYVPLMLLFLFTGCGEAPPLARQIDWYTSDEASRSVAERDSEMSVAGPRQVAPQVVDALPQDAGVVEPQVIVRVIFSSAMDPATTGEAFTLVRDDGYKVRGALTWDSEQRVLAFRPDEQLATQSYFVEVTQDATSVDGVELDEPFIAQFTVARPDDDKSTES